MTQPLTFLGLVVRARRATAALAVLGGLALIGLAAAPAQAFSSFGTSSGHEMITRAALACGATGAPEDCFQSAPFRGRSSISLLAGGVGPLPGSVEAPDAGTHALLFPAATHCLYGDYNIIGARTYFQTKKTAQANLLKCVRNVGSRMASAVQLAPRLLSEVNANTLPSCRYWVDYPNPYRIGTPITPGNPKCAVLNQLGRGLHSAQDFYAHSNWTDASLPGQNSLRNPPGLGQTGVPDFLRFRCSSSGTVKCSPLTETFPDKVITACLVCVNRITHGTLNKDDGIINPVTGVATSPGNSRGKIKDAAGVTNYQRAVTAAIAQTRATWDDFVAALKSRYPDQAQLMVEVLTCDKPAQPATCPSGALATGGGSTAGVADPALFGAGGAAVVAGAGLLVFTRRWRGGASQG